MRKTVDTMKHNMLISNLQYNQTCNHVTILIRQVGSLPKSQSILGCPMKVFLGMGDPK